MKQKHKEYVNLTIALTAPEKESLKFRSQAAGVSITEYVRRKALGIQIREDYVRGILRELLAIGTQLKDLQKHLEEGDRDCYEPYMKEFMPLMRKYFDKTSRFM